MNKPEPLDKGIIDCLMADVHALSDAMLSLRQDIILARGDYADMAEGWEEREDQIYDLVTELCRGTEYPFTADVYEALVNEGFFDE